MCMTGKAVADEDFDGADDGESTTILEASGEHCCDSVEVQLFQQLTDGVEAGLCQLDCLRVFCYSFVAFNLAESVSFIHYFG